MARSKGAKQTLSSAFDWCRLVEGLCQEPEREFDEHARANNGNGSGRMGTLWSAYLELRTHHRLVTSGPYSRIRHPMYVAFLAWATSLGLVIANWVLIVFAVCLAVIVVARVPREEQMMLERFGDEYREYMKRTGRFLPRW